MFKNFIIISSLCLLAPLALAHSLYPDLKTATYPLRSNRIDTTTLPGRVLLRFSNGVANVGKGRLELKGGSINGNGTRNVYQRIYSSHGGFTSRLAGSFTYHPEHSHTHFNNVASYKLRKIVGTTGIGSIVAQSEKVSFCLYDESVYNSGLPYYSNYPRYRSCGSSIQGISVGWVDVYDRSLPGQWIDITNVPSGNYWLESTADPENKILESNETNNTSRIKVSINNPGNEIASDEKKI